MQEALHDKVNGYWSACCRYTILVVRELFSGNVTLVDYACGLYKMNHKVILWIKV